MEQHSNKTKQEKLLEWVKKLGMVGFLFFLLKGLVWLYLIYYVGKKIN